MIERKNVAKFLGVLVDKHKRETKSDLSCLLVLSVLCLFTQIGAHSIRRQNRKRCYQKNDVNMLSVGRYKVTVSCSVDDLYSNFIIVKTSSNILADKVSLTIILNKFQTIVREY